MPPSFDVVIIGAGPAGAWAGYRLALAGARVAVVDGSHPREKPCGGGISARALRVLGHLRVGFLPRAVEVTSARFSAPGATAAVPLAGSSADAPALVIASRRDFDGALLQASIDAGATHVARRVTALEQRDQTWVITTDTSRLTAGWLIGADGANSLVRRRLLRPFSRAELSIASGYYVHGRTGTEIDVAFTEAPRGYLWSFPRPDHLAVGSCGQADGTSSPQLLDASAAWIGTRYGAPSDTTRYSWPIPTLTERGLLNETPAGRRWLLIGDAAGLVDPITREGIFFALQSAELAAQSFDRPDPAASYTAALRTTVHRELGRAARMKERFFRPPFGTLLVQSLQRSERIGRIMSELVSGQQTYHGLRRRLLFTGEWRLALHYLQLSARSR